MQSQQLVAKILKILSVIIHIGVKEGVPTMVNLTKYVLL